MMGEPNSAIEGSTGGSAPSAVFELLADETRFAILRALRTSGDQPVEYSTLRRRADINDSGRFNYHLMRLTDTLVADVDGGYELRGETEGLLDAVLASPLVGGEADHAAVSSLSDGPSGTASESARYSD